METLNDIDKEERFNMVAPKWWIDMIDTNSKKRGINRSAYIRQIAIDDNERIKTLKKEIAN